MTGRATTRRLGALLLLAAAACGDPTGIATGPPVAFALRAVNGAPLPVASGSVAGGRTVELVSGAVRFEGFQRRAGPVAVARSLRITGPGIAPAYETTTAPASFRRTGDTVEVAFAGTRREWLVLEDGGRTLRTIAASGCDAPAGTVCPDILTVLRYERVD